MNVNSKTASTWRKENYIAISTKNCNSMNIKSKSSQKVQTPQDAMLTFTRDQEPFPFVEGSKLLNIYMDNKYNTERINQ